MRTRVREPEDHRSSSDRGDRKTPARGEDRQSDTARQEKISDTGEFGRNPDRYPRLLGEHVVEQVVFDGPTFLHRISLGPPLNSGDLLQRGGPEKEQRRDEPRKPPPGCLSRGRAGHVVTVGGGGGAASDQEMNSACTEDAGVRR